MTEKLIRYYLCGLIIILGISCSWIPQLGAESTQTLTIVKSLITPSANPTIAAEGITNSPVPLPTFTYGPPLTATPLEKPVNATASTPISTGEAVCPEALPTRLSIGIYAYVIPQPPIPSRIRLGPGLGFAAKALAQPGQVMRILDGPMCTRGQVWWKVDLKFRDINGWIAEGSIDQYWLAPCPVKGYCPPLE
jgi:hypothetical protein